jgi:hypothetical protein
MSFPCFRPARGWPGEPDRVKREFERVPLFTPVRQGTEITYCFTDHHGISHTGKAWFGIGLPRPPQVGDPVTIEYYPSNPYRNRLADR